MNHFIQKVAHMKSIQLGLRIAMTVAAMLCAPALAHAQAGGPPAGEFKIGDRVEVDVTGSKRFFERGVIVEFRKNDMYNGRTAESGYFWRVRLDSMDVDEEGRVYKAADMRLLNPPAPAPADGGTAPPMPAGGLPPMPGGGPPPMPGQPPMPGPGTAVPPPVAPPMAGAGEFKIGDRVEVDVTGSKRFYERGTIVEYRKNDMYNGRTKESGYFWRVRLDSMDTDEEGRVFKAADMRPLGQQMQLLNIATTTMDFFAAQLTGTVMADRPLEKCPVDQKQVARSAKPDTAVIAKLIKCLWEAPSEPGKDGALTVDLTPLKVGEPRRWNRLTDMGNGNLNTMVYPIQADYTWKTFYRTQTRVLVSRGIFNCYVNSFSEWQCGLGESKKISEETIKKPATPRGRAL